MVMTGAELFVKALKEEDVNGVFKYRFIHSSPMVFPPSPEITIVADFNSSPFYCG